jgi:hypothetical protein
MRLKRKTMGYKENRAAARSPVVLFPVLTPIRYIQIKIPAKNRKLGITKLTVDFPNINAEQAAVKGDNGG